jgi:hypothetical protein
MKIKILLVIVCLPLLQACGNSSTNSSDPGAGAADPGTPTPAQAQAINDCKNIPNRIPVDIRYVFNDTVNSASCTTGCQIFTSQGSYCAGLLNNVLNNNCAQQQRQETHNTNCP